MTTFSDLPLHPAIQEGLARLEMKEPTPVQAAAFPKVIEGRDLLVQSRTGTGKTLAFGLPMLQKLVEPAGKGPRALVVAPTRELATQVATVLARLGHPLGIKVASLVGGGGYRDQFRALEAGYPIVVGTPGRLVDHLKRGSLDLSRCGLLVLDEADEILDMGFAEELDAVLAALPEDRQSLLFSATMPQATAKLAAKTLRDPERIAISSGLSAAPEITHVAYAAPREHRVAALLNVLFALDPTLAIVFCHTKAETETITERLAEDGITCAFLNGDLPQAQRTRTLAAFRRREIRVLVATDVAARGIDVSGVSHVFNLGVPQNPETYIHRVGRTGRAGASGVAATFVPPREAGRFRRMLQSAGVPLAIVPVPTAEAVRTKLRERLHESLTSRVAAELDPAMKTLAQELLGYMDPTDLVAVLLAENPAAKAAMLAGEDVPAFKTTFKEDAPGREDARPLGKARPARKLSEHHEPGMTRIHLNMGKAQHMTPGRLLQLVCSASGIKGDAVGAIALHPHFAFFDVKTDAAPGVVAALDGLNHKGRRLKANVAP